jgi:2',3'-cyclic-nucleotide 2'-phosphodiesterase (5'-nucleotidase family)
MDTPLDVWMSRSALSVAFALLVLCITVAPMVITTDSLQPTTIDITIAYTHDMHGHLYSEWTGSECSGGMPLLASKVQELRALRPALLFDCGDMMTGGAVNDYNNGLPMIEVMNAIGYDAIALDNHEFDPGTRALKNMIDSADFEVLSANVDWPGLPKPLAYSIETVNGYEIGVIGLSTSFWYAPDEVTFSNQANAVNSAVADLQGQGIDFIILLGCLTTSILSSVSGIDLLMKAGGSVQTIGNTLVVPSVGQYVSELGVLDLTIDTTDGTIDAYDFSHPTLESPLNPDETIVSIIDTWNAPHANYLDNAIGYFDSYQSTASVGSMMAEAILQETGADVGVYNFGGVRESIEYGFVTYRDLHHTEPFFNFLATVELKGSDVESVMSSNYYVTSIGSFNPDTWYTVASSNFTITEIERTYTTGAVNRQNYPSVTVVETTANYISREFPVSRADLLAVVDDCLVTISSLPDTYWTGGTPSSFRVELNEKLVEVRDALVIEDNQTAYSNLLTSIETIGSHVGVSCPRRWLTTNLGNIIDFLEFSPDTTTTQSTSPHDSTSPTGSLINSPWTPVVVIELVILAIVVVYYFWNSKMTVFTKLD